MKSPYDVIIKPVISEQSMDQAQEQKYTFKVAKDATKVDIIAAIEKIFDVQVRKVNIMNIEGKMKRMGRTEGRRSSYKKAIVTLVEGSKPIEFFQGL